MEIIVEAYGHDVDDDFESEERPNLVDTAAASIEKGPTITSGQCVHRQRLEAMMQFHKVSISSAASFRQNVEQLVHRIQSESSDPASIVIMQDRFSLFLRQGVNHLMGCRTNSEQPERLIGKRKRIDDEKERVMDTPLSHRLFSDELGRDLIHDADHGGDNFFSNIVRAASLLYSASPCHGTHAIALYECCELYNAMIDHVLKYFSPSAIIGLCTAVIASLRQILAFVLRESVPRLPLYVLKIDCIVQTVLVSIFGDPLADMIKSASSTQIQLLWRQVTFLVNDLLQQYNHETCVNKQESEDLQFVFTSINSKFGRARQVFILSRMLASVAQLSMTENSNVIKIHQNPDVLMASTLLEVIGCDAINNIFARIAPAETMVTIGENDTDVFAWLLHLISIEHLLVSNHDQLSVTVQSIIDRGYSTVGLFRIFVAVILFYDADMLLDFFVNTETQALLYLSKALKVINMQSLIGDSLIKSGSMNPCAASHQNTAISQHHRNKKTSLTTVVVWSRTLNQQTETCNEKAGLADYSANEEDTSSDHIGTFELNLPRLLLFMEDLNVKLMRHHHAEILPFNPSVLCKRIESIIK